MSMNNGSRGKRGIVSTFKTEHHLESLTKRGNELGAGTIAMAILSTKGMQRPPLSSSTTKLKVFVC